MIFAAKQRGKNMNEPYKDWIVRYYASHDDIPPGHTDGELTELIRCKDCKHYYALNEVRGNCSEYNFVEKIPIDFCSWAERKEE